MAAAKNMPAASTWESSANDFMAGRTAMLYHSTGSMTNILKSASFPVGVAPMPRGKQLGSTMGGGSLGGMKPIHAHGGKIDGIHHIDQPDWWSEGGDMTPEEFGLERARQLETAIHEIGLDKVAAFIGEPIQGAGGVIIPPSTYWPEIQRICDKYGILLIADEVITGFGRTGNWFGSQTFGIKPHIMTIAKGLSSGYQPIGGSIVCDEVAAVIAEGLADPLFVLKIIPGVIVAGVIAIIIATVLCAFYIGLVGAPLAALLGQRLDTRFGLALAVLSAVITAIVALAAFGLWPLFDTPDWQFALLVFAYALPAGLLYRRAVLTARQFSPFAEARA